MAKKEKEKKDPIAEETTAEQAAESAEAPEVNPWEEKYHAEHDA